MFSFLSSVLKTTSGRFLLICFLTLLLNIPLIMIDSIISSRSQRFDNVSGEIAEIWGGQQTMVMPLLSVPVQKRIEERVWDPTQKKYIPQERTIVETLAVLPSELNVETVIAPEERHQGIYNVLVHRTNTKITGLFTPQDFSTAEKEGKILLKEIRLNLGLDASSIRGNLGLYFNGQKLEAVPGTQWREISGISAPVDIPSLKKELTVTFDFSFNGSGTISLAPIGKKNLFTVSSSWPHPAFRGKFRPDTSEISENGFSAQWNIPYIARDYRQTLSDGHDLRILKEQTADIALFNPAPVYKQAIRLCSYGIMFIALSFVMMFLIELKAGRKFGAIQYIIVGLAVSLFFLTVLSLAEHIAFSKAYTAAAAIVTAMISWYVYAAQHNFKIACIYGAAMASLYGLLYIMLTSSDYALLIGTILLLVALSAIMGVTARSNQDLKE